MSGLASLADLLRRQHAARHGIHDLLPFDQLQPSEQIRWLDEADAAADSIEALGSDDA